MRRSVFLLFFLPALVLHAQKAKLPLDPDSVRFAVIGDMGTGQKPQYDVARQMVKFRQAFPFDFVITMGDNLYEGAGPKDYQKKFEEPYRDLLSAGVKFYASLGNQDDDNELAYPGFNMGGKRYYSFQRGNVDFFVLDTNSLDAPQAAWIEEALAASKATWKICYFHHPLYTNVKDPTIDANQRRRLEPIFERYGVGAVFSGHEHVYERIKPQHGIYYFVLGNSGQLKLHNLKSSSETVKGFDTDRAFALVEISGDRLHFQTVSRTGDTVDSGDLPLLRVEKR